MTLSSLETEAVAHTHRLIRLAQEHFGVSPEMPVIRFDLRGKAAGMVVFRQRQNTTIRYNRVMLAENGADFIEQTVPHEVAHLVVRQLHGARARPHGAEWRSLMRFFGAEPKRCHSFAVSQPPARVMRYFLYRCECRHHRLSAIRHNRSQLGTSYLCRRCGTRLFPVPERDA